MSIDLALREEEKNENWMTIRYPHSSSGWFHYMSHPLFFAEIRSNEYDG
jgi:hypothetical protein